MTAAWVTRAVAVTCALVLLPASTSAASSSNTPTIPLSTEIGHAKALRHVTLTADGQRVVFVMEKRYPRSDLFSVRTDGTGLVRLDTRLASSATRGEAEFDVFVAAQDSRVVYRALADAEDEHADLMSAPVDRDDPLVLVDGARRLGEDIAVSDGHVFYLEDVGRDGGRLASVPVAGGPVRSLSGGYRLRSLSQVWTRAGGDVVFVAPDPESGARSLLTASQADGIPRVLDEANASGSVAGVSVGDSAVVYTRTDGTLHAGGGTGVRPLAPASHDAATPELSPDGSTVVYVDQRTRALYSVPVHGGPPLRLANLDGRLAGLVFAAGGRTAVHATTSDDGSGMSLHAAPLSGEPAQTIVDDRDAPGGVAYWALQGDGKHLLYLARGDDGATIWQASIHDGTSRPVARLAGSAGRVARFFRVAGNPARVFVPAGDGTLRVFSLTGGTPRIIDVPVDEAAFRLAGDAPEIVVFEHTGARRAGDPHLYEVRLAGGPGEHSVATGTLPNADVGVPDLVIRLLRLGTELLR